MQEVASALAFLHGVGVYHADLKPENLLLSTKNRLDGTIKIIDFGCAVVTDDYLDDDDDEIESRRPKRKRSPVKKASSTGTTAYWPPERFVDKGEYSATAAMDMWSVGVILYVSRSLWLARSLCFDQFGRSWTTRLTHVCLIALHCKDHADRGASL